MAGIVHDIGKLYIPAEILSKPTEMTKTEITLIQQHSKAGYDILKEIEFPRPVAEIVLQHHERLDGTGYPSGISGNDIMLEAKILGVADVVEAMSSHRPYRPALGIDKALMEIRRNKNILYDSQVVNACINIFKENRFHFKNDVNGSPLFT
jgi:HD-GYP domain-containing protein (c-di-GMP phosphodiesterase class II)